MNTAQVRVVDGPDRGLVVELSLGGRLVVGRSPEADVVLRDANVSRRHCALEHRLAGVYVEDLNSRGGTLLNGRSLPSGGGALADDAAQIQIGGSHLQVVRENPQERPPEIPGLRIDRRLGSGGSGTVYAGRIEATGALVAVKLLAADADEVSRQRFEREAALRGKLQHPAIARIYDLRRVEGRPCLIRELVEGISLEQRLDEGGPLPWRDAVWIGVVVAGALAHAHARGIVHRDVKPGNVMLGADGRQPKLIDFDLAKRLPTEVHTSLTRLTQTGEGLGSLSYLAPEQLTGARDVGVAADIYGLGMTLYHAITGERPFCDTEPEDFIDALYTSGPRAITQLVPAIPAPVRQVLERAYARQAEQRYASAELLAQALGALLQ